MKVPLMRYGNPQSQAGYTSLFYINNPQFTAPLNLSPGGMGNNEYYFQVSISKGYTNIVLIENNVRSEGAARMGVLKIATAFPVGYKLADNKSPYDLLKDVRDVFVSKYMEPLRGVPGHRFLKEFPGPEALIEAVDRYSLVEAGIPHRVMEGRESVFLRTDRIREFLRDFQYPELTGYKDVIVAAEGDYMPRIELQEIPRRPKWRLSVNGIAQKWPSHVRDPFMEIVEVSKESGSPYYTYSAVTVNLRSLLENGGNDKVKVDTTTETVCVTLEKIPVERKLRLRFRGEGSRETLMRGLHFNLEKREIYPDRDGNLRLNGTDIDKPVRVKYEGKDYKIESETVGDEIVITSTRRNSRSKSKRFISDYNTSGGDGGNNISGNGWGSIGREGAGREENSGISDFWQHPAVLGGVIFVALIIGYVIGCFFPFTSFFKGEKEEAAEVVAVEDSLNKEEQDYEVKEEVWFSTAEGWEEIRNLLKRDNLSFDVVNKTADRISSLRRDTTELAKAALDENKELVDSVMGYKAVVDALVNGEVGTIKKSEKFLNPNHKWMVWEIHTGWRDSNGEHYYYKEGCDIATREFKDKAGAYKSFKELETLHLGKKENKDDTRLKK